MNTNTSTWCAAAAALFLLQPGNTEPPADAEHPTTAPTSGHEDLIIYPKNGQTNDQQAADRYECHNWAKSKTKFDPTLPNGGLAVSEAEAARSAYNRAMTACLSGRGYEVR